MPRLTEMLRDRCALMMFAGFGLAVAPGAFGQSYTFIDLGTLGEPGSAGEGLNDAGLAVGWAKRPIDSVIAPVAFGPGGPVELEIPQHAWAGLAHAANSAGAAVGSVTLPGDFGPRDFATLWINGRSTNLGTLGGEFSVAHAINDAGQIVGQSEAADRGTVAFIWKNGIMTALEGLGGGDAEARDINESGLIAGWAWSNFNREAVLWKDGNVWRVLSRSGGVSSAFANAVNESNLVAGRVTYPDFRTLPASWDDAGLTVLRMPNGQTYGDASDVNDAGLIVGWTSSGGHGGGGSQSAVLWDAGHPFKLTDLAQQVPAGWRIEWAMEINERGQIVGTGAFGGGFRAFRLDPIADSLGMTSAEPGLAGRMNEVTVRGATPGETVHVVYGRRAGSTSVPGCPGVTVEIAQPSLVGSAVADTAGLCTVEFNVPAGAAGRTVLFQSVERSACRVSGVVTTTFQ